MNKNESLARCRLLWATMLKYNCIKARALRIIYGCSNFTYPVIDDNRFYHDCPLCEYCRVEKDIQCKGCIDWGKTDCDSIGTSYYIWTRNQTSKTIQGVIDTIDIAIKKFDETGDWK